MSEADQQRWKNARWAVEKFARENGMDGLRARINELKKSKPETFRYRLEGRRYLLEELGSAFDLIGLAAEYRQSGRQLGQGPDTADRDECFNRALALYRTAMAQDRTSEVRHAALVGSAAVYMDLDDLDKAEELCLEVLAESPENEPALNVLGFVRSHHGY